MHSHWLVQNLRISGGVPSEHRGISSRGDPHGHTRTCRRAAVMVILHRWWRVLGDSGSSNADGCIALWWEIWAAPITFSRQVMCEQSPRLFPHVVSGMQEQ